jgi:hypothetical protein
MWIITELLIGVTILLFISIMMLLITYNDVRENCYAWCKYLQRLGVLEINCDEIICDG